MNAPEAKFGVVGPTGLVGGRIMEQLEHASFVSSDIRLFGSERSAGDTLEWRGGTYSIENSAQAEWEGLDVVLMSAGGDVSREYAPLIAKAGAVVIDNSYFWRHDAEVPLVVAEVNPGNLKDIPKGIVANPNCTTMQAMPVLKVLHDAGGLEKVVMSSYQSVSGQGRKGVSELLTQTRQILDGDLAKRLIEGDLSEDELAVAISAFPRQVAFNVAPHAGEFIGPDTSEERKFINETRKILGLSRVAIDATCVRVPVLNGHSMAIDAKFAEKITVEEAEALLREAAGVSLVDVPQPMYASGHNDVFVGRVRESEVFKKGLQMFISGDNLLKGAATNAVQIAELLVGQYLRQQRS